MNTSGMRPISLTILLMLLPAIGCQSMRGSQTAAIGGNGSVIRTVKSERDLPDRGSVAGLSQELEASATSSGSDDAGESLWSKLSAPTRFLLPRTDADTPSSAILEAGQGLDDGF